MSELLFKIMAHSYCRYHDQNNFLEDCLSAISSRITQLDSKVNGEYKQIAEALSLQQNQMSVIMEEQTERSQPDIIKYEQWMKHTKQKFNNEATKMIKIEENVEKLANIYKHELLEMSKQITKWETKNQQMKIQMRNAEKVSKMLEIQNNQLKDQIASESASNFINEMSHNIESVFNVKKNKMNTAKSTSRDKKQEAQLQESQTNFEKNNKANIPSVSPKVSKQGRRPSVIQVRIHEQKQIEQDLQKWKKLSKKFDSLKSKLVSYEQQIQQKDLLIKNLKQELKGGSSIQNQEKRKIKTANTTLRGEKTVLQNQLASVKKLLTEKNQLCKVQQIELESLKTQFQTATDNAKWQNTVISQLKQSISKTHGNSQLVSQAKVQRLEQINSQLVEVLTQQQNQLNDINNRTKEIEDAFDQQINRLTGRITELQMILDEKNECIVRMKNKKTVDQNYNPNIPQKNGYLAELVRVLTKKVADRDQIIRRMDLKK